MSQILKAKNRILRNNRSSFGVQTTPQHHKQFPRKFTLSSITHNIDKKSNHESSPKNFTRTQRHKTVYLFQNNDKNSDGPFNIKQKESDYSNSRAIQLINQGSNTERRSVNSLISNQKLRTPHYEKISQYEQNYPQQRSARIESPSKVIYRTFHQDKINLMLVPAQKRQHKSPFKPKQCSRQFIQSFVDEKKTESKCFIDDFFPPQRTIIFNKKIMYQQEGLKFQRLSRIYHNELFIIKNCEPTYLSAGKYTNPYLYNALCILSEQPQRILSIFGSQLSNQNGIYYVNLCKDGVWRYIVVDDFAPIKLVSRKQLLFMHSQEVDNTTQIWPALIEKAIAKIYGTYLDLALSKEDGMMPLFRILTGAPVSCYELNKDFRSYLILIDNAIKKKHIVTLEQIDEQNQQTAYLKNLNIFNAYKVVDIKKSGIKIRNYAENELTTKLAFNECLIFKRLVIYRIEPFYCYQTQKLRHKKSYFSLLKLTVKNQSKFYMDIWQNNPAYYKKHLGSKINYNISKYKIIAKKTSSQRQQKDEQQNQSFPIDAGKEYQLSPGIYLLEIHLCQQRQQDFTLSYYGQKAVTMQRIRNGQQWPDKCHCK